MTIKEIETRTGLARANVRYYETEGLIHPTRGANGYRDYSQDDLDTLLKIKLLRQLRFSLEDIRALQSGQLELDPALADRIAALDQEHTELDRSIRLCQTMRDDRVSYPTLNAPFYLDRLDQPSEPPRWREDQPPQPRFLWRRYFARTLDLLFCTFVYFAFLSVVFRANLAVRAGSVNFLDQWAVMLLALATEPLFLHFFGTTPGKFFFGLRLTRSDGSYLGYGQALLRTGLVLVAGLGLNLPLIGTVCCGWSFWRAKRDEPLLWQKYVDEAYTEGSLPKQSYWEQNRSFFRLAGGAAALLCVFFLTLSLQIFASAPKHQNADLTVEQFVDNYNQFSEFMAGPGANIARLNIDGTFSAPEDTSGTHTIVLFESGPIQLDFVQEEGVLTGISYNYKFYEGVSTALPIREAAKSIWAFLYGRCDLSRDQLKDIIQQLEERPDQPFSFHQEGVDIEYKPDIQGYTFAMGSCLFPSDSQANHLDVDFSVSLTKS